MNLPKKRLLIAPPPLKLSPATPQRQIWCGGKSGAFSILPFLKGGEEGFNRPLTGLMSKAGLFVFGLLWAGVAFSGAPNALAAVEGLTLEDEAYLELKTTDTASTTLLAGKSQGGKITVTVEDDYLDILMQKGATLILDSQDGVNFTVTTLEGDLRNWKAEKSCPTPTTSRLELDSQGGPATLKITISSSPACATAADDRRAKESSFILPFLKGGGDGFLTLLTRFINFLLGLI